MVRTVLPLSRCKGTHFFPYGKISEDVFLRQTPEGRHLATLRDVRLPSPHTFVST